MYTIVLTVYFWLVSIFSILLSLPICLIAFPFVDQKTFARIYEIITSHIMLYSMIVPGFWEVNIIDNRKDKNWEDKKFIIIANHISFVDSLFLGLIPVKKKFMIAKIFTKIPIFGWLVKTSGFIDVDKNDKTTTYNAVERAIHTIGSDNSSLAIFPEGMRSPIPYQLCDFKTGAFRIAKATQIPILPLTLKGTAEAMRIGGIVNFAAISVTIDEPFFIEHEKYDMYIKNVKEMIDQNLKTI